jgi:hypothetical protein
LPNSKFFGDFFLIIVKNDSHIFFSVQAAQNGKEACLKLLLEKGANAEEKDNNDNTALIWVCFFKFAVLVGSIWYLHTKRTCQ